MAWILRGLRNGVVTTPYPSRPDDYGAGFRSAVTVRGGPGAADGDLAALCPTGAITSAGSTDAPVTVSLDQGRCILCGRCVSERPDVFAFSSGVETSALERAALVVPHRPDDARSLATVRHELAERVRLFRRSVHIRHVDAGSDGADEWEVAALLNPVYDVQRLGIFFTATPRHADVLLVTGTGTAGMAGPLRRTYDAMPNPKVVIAAGTDATSAGLIGPTYASGSGVGAILPVDVFVPGSPPSPFSLLHAILLGLGRLGQRGVRP
jgi:Ni,Fe-hydrogenase III small subunit/ferredoxin